MNLYLFVYKHKLSENVHINYKSYYYNASVIIYLIMQRVLQLNTLIVTRLLVAGLQGWQ